MSDPAAVSREVVSVRVDCVYSRREAVPAVTLARLMCEYMARALALWAAAASRADTLRQLAPIAAPGERSTAETIRSSQITDQYGWILSDSTG